MKKGLTILLSTVCIASMASAQDEGLSFTSRFTNTAPTIDGDLNPGEWVNALKIEVDATDEVRPGVVSADSGPIVPPGLQTRDDFNATIYVMNDAANLYIAVDVNDDILIFSKADTWRNDSAEVRVDSNFSRLATKEGDQKGYATVNRGNGGKNDGMPAGAVAEAKAKANGKGWTMEFSTPTTGYAETIGFDMAINDSDTTTTDARDSQVRINGLTDNGWQDEREWARLTLPKQSSAKHWELME